MHWELKDKSKEKMTGGGGRGVQGSLEVGSIVDVMEIHCIHA